MSSPDLQRGPETAPSDRAAVRGRPAGLGSPRSPHRHPRLPDFEKHTRIFMRVSGSVLFFLVLGHLFVMLMWDDGVYRIDFNFVAQRWHSPFWRVWDLLLLWLAELHGGNGLRTIIGDYTRSDRSRFWLTTLLVVSMVFTLTLGSYVLISFDPNIS
jgi:succinate dehydrogenase / fumarate reductase membrane anchor subunit